MVVHIRHGSDEQIFGGDEQVRSWGSERLRSEKAAPNAFPGIK
jgi:hypothetical protein